MTDAQRRRGIAAVAAVTAAALLCAVGVMFSTPSLTELQRGPVLERAMHRGTLIVGVRSYARPAPPGTPTPAEPDNYDVALAEMLASRLGLRLHLVGLASSDQDAALRDGRADLVIAGAAEAPQSGTGLAATEGSYDDMPGMLVTLRAGKVGSAADLAGASVCVPQGSGYASTLVRRHGAQPRTFPSSVHAASAFMAGECQALVDHGDVLERLLRNDEWRFYRAVVRGLEADADASVRIVAGDSLSRDWLNAAVSEWRKSGAQDRARAARVGNVQFEIGLLKDGLVCHS